MEITQGAHEVGNKPLHLACLTGDLARVNELLKTGQINKCNSLKQTAFHFACWKNDLSIIKVLVNHQNNVLSQKCVKRKKGLDYLIESPNFNIEAFKYCINVYYYSSSNDDLCEILRMLIKHNRKEAMEIMLKHEWWTTNCQHCYFTYKNISQDLTKSNTTLRVLRKEILKMEIAKMLEEIEEINRLDQQ